jgi:cytochrome c biogenesis protein CcdA
MENPCEIKCIAEEDPEELSQYIEDFETVIIILPLIAILIYHADRYKMKITAISDSTSELQFNKLFVNVINIALLFTLFAISLKFLLLFLTGKAISAQTGLTILLIFYTIFMGAFFSIYFFGTYISYNIFENKK